MTTYSLSGIYVYGQDINNTYTILDAGELTLDLVQLDGFDSYYYAHGFGDATFLQSIEVVLDGNQGLSLGGQVDNGFLSRSFAYLTEVTYGAGSVTQTMYVFDPLTDVEYFFWLGGDALPSINSATDADAFLNSVLGLSGSLPAAFQPFTNFLLADLPGVSVTENDVVVGDDSANQLSGGIGSDTLVGGAGDDTLFGDDGTDQAVIEVAQSNATVTVLDSGIIEVSSTEGVDLLVDIEEIVFDDATVQTADLIPPGETRTGTSDPDSLAGTAGDDTIAGAGAGDTLVGNGGADLITGGTGFDSLYGGAGDDTLIGGDGYDYMDGESGDDSMVGNNGFDFMYGWYGDDTMEGGLGIDTLYGENGNDLLSGQGGSDELYGGFDNDTLNGNAGTDSLDGGFGDDLLNGGINNDTLAGNLGDDTLNGNNGADLLNGDEGSDRLEGNAGSDTLDGGAGDDVLRGGIGADTFVFMAGSGNDRIADFQNNIDTIELETALFTETTPVTDDVRNYASFDADGNLVLTFGTDTLTFTGVTNTGAILDEVVFI